MTFFEAEEHLRQSLFFFILLLEIYGTLVIVLSSHRILFKYLRRGQKGLRLNFARHIALGLEYLLAAEIIRTITVRNWEEIRVLLIILILRAFLAWLVHWEIRQEHRLEKMEQE